MTGILQNLYRLQMLDLDGGNPSQVAGLRAGIPEGILTNYDRQRARGKKGIAIVRNHVCGNCRMQVPVAVSASLTAGKVQVCGNCGLYLCLPEPGDEMAHARIAQTKQPRRRKKQVEELTAAVKTLSTTERPH